MNEAAVTTWFKALEQQEFAAVCPATSEVIPQIDSSRPQQRSESRRLIFPGAFNPLHDGHRAMADIAEDVTGLPIEFELSIANVDKPSLPREEILQRLQQFPPPQVVWLTHAKRFREKAAIFPQATFVVGADTIARVADCSYYDGVEKRQLSAISHIASCGGRFLVFGRLANGKFQSLESLDLPDELRAICTGVDRATFEIDISSSEIRLADGQ